MTADRADWPFPAEDVAAIAENRGLEIDRLSALLEDHQATMADSPGVENLVYEWRKQFDATLLERTEALYVVAPPAWAWEEFADHLDASPTERTALRAVHELAATARTDLTTADADTMAPMILVR